MVLSPTSRFLLEEAGPCARVSYPGRDSPERGGRFLGEICPSRQHDLQRAKRAHRMPVELRIRLDPAKHLPEITVAGAREYLLFQAV